MAPEEHTDLDLSLELNRQLHATLRRKQEEICALKETNAQLRDLAKHTEHHATILHALTTSLQRDSVSHRTEHSWISLLTREEPSDPSSTALTDRPGPAAGVMRQPWSSCEDAEDTGSNCPSGYKQPRLVQADQENLKARPNRVEQAPGAGLTPKQSPEVSSGGLIAQRVNVFGAFRGLRVVTQTPSVMSDLHRSGDDGKVCFKTAVRDHSTVKTKVFPHGKAFTAHTPSGSCRFLWVPEQLSKS